QGRPQQRPIPIHVGTRTGADEAADDQMVDRVHRQLQLGETTVSQALPAFTAGATAAHVVSAAVAGVQARGIQGGAADAAAASQVAANGGVQQAAGAGPAQQAAAGFLQGRPVRYAAQADGSTQFGKLVQLGDDAAIVGFVKGLQDQAGKELRLGV